MYSLRNKKTVPQSSQILFLSQVDPMLENSTTPSPPDVQIRGADRKRATVPQLQSGKKAEKQQSENKSLTQNSKGKISVISSQKRALTNISQSLPTSKKDKLSTYPELIKRLENIAHTEESINKHFTTRELQVLIEPHYVNVPNLKAKRCCVDIVLQLIYQHIIDCKQNDCIPSPIALPVTSIVKYNIVEKNKQLFHRPNN